MSNMSQMIDEMEKCIRNNVLTHLESGSEHGHFDIYRMAWKCNSKAMDNENVYPNVYPTVKSRLLQKLKTSGYNFAWASPEWGKKYGKSDIEDVLLVSYQLSYEQIQSEVTNIAKRIVTVIENESWDRVATGIDERGFSHHSFLMNIPKNVCGNMYCEIFANSFPVESVGFDKTIENEVAKLLKEKKMFVKRTFEWLKDNLVMTTTNDLEMVYDTSYEEILKYYTSAAYCAADKLITESKTHCSEGKCYIDKLRRECDPRFYINHGISQFKNDVVEIIRKKYDNFGSLVKHDNIYVFPVVPNIKE